MSGTGPTPGQGWTADAHRHLGVLPAYPFYGGPPVSADTGARATIAELIADMDAEHLLRQITRHGAPAEVSWIAGTAASTFPASDDDWTAPRTVA